MKFYFKLKTFVPLIVIFGLIIAFVFLRASFTGYFGAQSLMIDFMAGFFLVFGIFKLIKLPAFVEAYRMYDVLAKRNKIYAYIYPFVEIGLGVAFLSRFQLDTISWITLVLMSINSIGAYNGIKDKKVLMCACLGGVFKLPMSYVSLGEDLLMIVMAVVIAFGPVL